MMRPERETEEKLTKIFNRLHGVLPSVVEVWHRTREQEDADPSDVLLIVELDDDHYSVSAVGLSDVRDLSSPGVRQRLDSNPATDTHGWIVFFLSDMTGAVRLPWADLTEAVHAASN